MFDAHIELAIIEYQEKKNYQQAIYHLDYCLQNTKDAVVLTSAYLHKGVIYSDLNGDRQSLKMFNKGLLLKVMESLKHYFMQ